MKRKKKRKRKPGSLKQYLDFCEMIREERQVCESCGATAEEVGQKHLHVHHLQRVQILGYNHPAIRDPKNVLLLCNACHALMHPGIRRYNWMGAAITRSQNL